MTEQKEGVLIRMPVALKEVLTVQASASMRSFNQEVCARLYETLGESPAERLAAVEGVRMSAGAVKGPQLALALSKRRGAKSAPSKKHAASKRGGKVARRG